MPETGKPLNGQRILFSVLNWGLGHATRSSVLIEALLNRGAEVHIASDGDSLRVLELQFPQAKCHIFPSYHVKYSTGGVSVFAMLLQAAGSLRTMRKEQAQLKYLHKLHCFTGIISDNRPASWLGGIPSVYLTHQVRIKAGKWSALLTNQHARLYRKFSEVWVPDSEESTLSGELSEHVNTKQAHRYIGWLSRLERVADFKTKYDWAVVLSGPEPSRSQWEAEMLAQCESWPSENGVIVRGKPQAEKMDVSLKVEVIDYLDEQALSKLYAQSELIIARSGYSTLMDLARLNQKALLIPTPGQPEQEYLADSIQIEGWKFVRQHELDATAIAHVKNGHSPKLESPKWPADLFRLFEGK